MNLLIQNNREHDIERKETQRNLKQEKD